MGCFVKDQCMRFGYFLTPKSGHAGWSSHFRALEMPYTKLELFILTSIFWYERQFQNGNYVFTTTTTTTSTTKGKSNSASIERFFNRQVLPSRPSTRSSVEGRRRCKQGLWSVILQFWKIAKHGRKVRLKDIFLDQITFLRTALVQHTKQSKHETNVCNIRECKVVR